jgi:peptide/nickel transport system substrate-binding protein
MFPVKAQKLRFQIVSSTNAIDKLQKGEVDYITPQFTKDNSKKLKSMEADGFKQLNSWQLGYGYIGINAGKVPNVYVRRAIMAAMQTELALDFYEAGTCQSIDWPMSLVSWAYPRAQDGTTPKKSQKAWTQWNGIEDAKTKINEYVGKAEDELGQKPNLKYTFTIAGASITEHPTYAVFKQAAEILNSAECGWDVEVKADSQALTKLSTGALQVWAAAWGAAIDPDMYQVYHKDSKATSVFAWGYREIKADTTKYNYEWKTINEQLSPLIDEARSMMDPEERKPKYEQAMGLVLDLAIEMPVYQRKTLYAYNTNTLKGLNDDVNPYSSPLEKIWDVELKA